MHVLHTKILTTKYTKNTKSYYCFFLCAFGDLCGFMLSTFFSKPQNIESASGGNIEVITSSFCGFLFCGSIFALFVNLSCYLLVATCWLLPAGCCLLPGRPNPPESLTLSPRPLPPACTDSLAEYLQDTPPHKAHSTHTRNVQPYVLPGS